MGKSIPFKAETDIPPLSGKVILVTGGNAGLGKQSVLEFARHKPAQIWLAARNLEKAKAASEEIKEQVPDAPIRLLELDLSSLDALAPKSLPRTTTFTSESDRLDILMLNAGVMATPPSLTKYGYEHQFGTNHVGHALLTKLLIPVLDKTAKGGTDADVRVVALSSHGHVYCPKGGIVFDSLKTDGKALGAYGRYGQSRLANILFARQLATEYPQFTVSAIHPGVVQTNLMTGATGSPLIVRLLAPLAYRFLTTAEQGARNQLWAAVSKDVKSGEYYEPAGIGGLANNYGKDDELAKKLWDWTEKELGGQGI